MAAGCISPTDAVRRNDSHEETPMEEVKKQNHNICDHLCQERKHGLVFKEYMTNLSVFSQSCFATFDKSLLPWLCHLSPRQGY